MNTFQEHLHAMVRCRTLQGLIDIARGCVGNPLILANITCNVLAITSEPEIYDPRWLQISNEKALPVDLINVTAYQSALRSGTPSVTEDSTGLTVVRCPVAHEQRLIGYLMMPCYSGAPSTDEIDALMLVADLCAIRLQKDLNYVQYPEDMLEFFVSDLLNGVIRDEQRILERCRALRWEFKLPYRVLTICREEHPEKTSGDDYLALAELCRTMSEQFSDSTIFVYGNHIKAIVPVHDKTTRDALVLRDLENFLAKYHLLGGVSQSSSRIRNLYSRHQQALKAMEMGTLLSATGPLFFYDTYSVYHCLEKCMRDNDILQFCHSAVLLLETYDRKYGTELLGTLHAYLSCRQNICDAASSLFVHRNTLSKRLEKINDIIHVDLNDAETVFHLMFSYRILEYYGATSMRESYDTWMEKSPTLRHP